MAEESPDLLTVEEAGAALRVGRTKAYAMAREWRETGGRSGLPVIDLGHLLRVPRRALEELIGTRLTAGGLGTSGAPVSGDGDGQTSEPEVAPAVASEPSPDSARATRPTTRRRRQRNKNASPNQLNLFDATD